MQLPNLSWELNYFKKGFSLIAGADEVGRGAWAGPVVAAAIVLAPAPDLENFYQRTLNEQIAIQDSKQMKFSQRRRIATWLKAHCLGWGIGESPPSLINRIGLAKATRTAFRQALLVTRHRLPRPQRSIDFLLLDAFYLPHTRTLNRSRQLALIKGDAQILSVAAASIIAKDYRDSLMHRLAKKFPAYGWGRNKGYGTRFHQQAIRRYGQTRHHRRQFLSTWLSH